jgi:hypothetical protein
MWILEASGEILQGRRMWLKPGKQYLFGRVKKDGVRFAIDHKTVSRKHFIIEVSNVADGEVAQIHARTKITIIDQNSKSGTRVNGEELKGTDYRARELKHAENSVRPGNLEQELLIKWVPCVITFHLLRKELKSGVLKQKQDRIKNLGVKAVADFVPDTTTHVVAAKRNTPKGLQALINGQHLVGEDFVQALEIAATPTTLSQEENLSSLELDFDSNWPNEKDFLPAPGKEPTARPDETYQPGPDRTHIFKDYTFVFCDAGQHERLLPVIATGHGKALLQEVDNGKTTVNGLLAYLSNVAGKKTFGDPSQHPAQGGVVLVRWTAPDDYSDWANNLIQQVSLKLDQRAIDQSEFLDAVLANDASLLRQSIPLESFNDGLQPPPPSAAPSFVAPRKPSHTQLNGTSANGTGSRSQTNGTQQFTQQSRGNVTEAAGVQDSTPAATESEQAVNFSPPESSNIQPESSALPESSNNVSQIRKPRYRPLTKVEFDDDFDPDEVVPFDEDDDVPSVESEEEVTTPQPAPFSAPIKNTQSANPRKRHRTATPDPDDGGSDIDNLLPAANAMKRQRTDWTKEMRTAVKPQAAAVVPAKKPRKEIDVREAVKRKREKELERAQHDGSDDEGLPAHDPADKKPADLVVIEHILPIRKARARDITQQRGQNPEDDPRWDPRWNGLKNFKKFRPQQRGSVRRVDHVNRVFVPLVEVSKKSDGLGEEYWDKSDEERERDRKKKAKQNRRKAQESLSQTQSKRVTQEIISSDVEGEDVRFRPGRSGRTATQDSSPAEADEDEPQTSPAAERLRDEAAAILDHDIDMSSPRRTRTQTQTQLLTQTQSTTQRSSGHVSSGRATTQATRGTKRPASSASTAGGKRQKTLPVTYVPNSDDSGGESDDMKFRFGQGRTRRAGR